MCPPISRRRPSVCAVRGVEHGVTRVGVARRRDPPEDGMAAQAQGSAAAPAAAHGRPMNMVSVEPVSPAPPRAVRAVTMRQEWRNVGFLHWEITSDQAREHLPHGIEPDLFEGRAFVGLIGLQIRLAPLGTVPVPYVFTFPEINVRLYSVDGQGRRGIVFCSLDAGRLVPTLLAR